MWTHLELFEPILRYLDLIGAIWAYLDIFRAILSQFKTFGAISSHLEPCGAISTCKYVLLLNLIIHEAHVTVPCYDTQLTHDSRDTNTQTQVKY